MRWLVGLGLVVAMVTFGIGVYHAAGMLRGGRPLVHRPNEVSAPPLPGTLFVAQAGAIYRFQHGNFVQVTHEDGWMQPAVTSDGRQLVAVQRRTNLSDLYLLSSGGKPLAQLTHNLATGPVEGNHWSFFPRYSPDGAKLFYDYDPKSTYNTYNVDLAIYASPANPSAHGSVQWSYPNEFTGGDVNPVPLRNGGVIFTRYSIDDSFQVHSQIWLEKRPGTVGTPLTPPEMGCEEPALSPDEKLIAMVCTNGSNQSADLDIATIDPTTLKLGSPATLIGDQPIASPSFSPDGKMIAYLAPSTSGGQFQLWTVDSSGRASVREITTDLGLDSSSAPAWVAG